MRPHLRPGQRPAMRSGLLALALAAAAVLASAPYAWAGPMPGPGGVVGGERLGRPGVVYVPASGRPAPPVTSSLSYLLADTGSGDVLAAKEAHLRLRPASTQKILTALVLLPELQTDQSYTARYEDAAVDGSKVGIVPGSPYSVKDLFLGLFLMSGNDAANALANAAGGVPDTVRRMREKARELQALDTVIVNPSGLDAPGQLSSAYDLALFARAALQRSDFRIYCSTRRAHFPGKVPARGPRPTFEIFTQDKLLLNYDGAIGVKTGFTTLARSTFVGAATRGGRTLVVTLMHAGPHAWREAAALLDWGFANAAAVQPVGHLVPAGGDPVAQEGVPAQRAVAPALTATAGVGGGQGPAAWAWLLAALAGTLALLRTRVLVRRRRRHGMSGPGRPRLNG